MAATFDICRVQPETSTPQLTSFVGVGDPDNKIISNASTEECTKIIIDLNQEVARYCAMAVALGTNIDSDYLRLHLRQSRLRAWDHAKSVKKKLIPMIRKKKFKMECCEDLERIYRVFCASLEYLEGLIFKTLLIQLDFPLYSGSVLIDTGLSEIVLPKKGFEHIPEPLDISLEEREKQSLEEIAGLQREITDIQEMVYEMNSRIAIQPWEIEPELEVEKFTTDDANKERSSAGSSVTEFGASSGNEEQRKIRYVSVVILIVIIVLIGGIVGILMGVLDY